MTILCRAFQETPKISPHSLSIDMFTAEENLNFARIDLYRELKQKEKYRNDNKTYLKV